MIKLSTIAYIFMVGVLLLLADSCTHRATPKSVKVDKTRKIKCRCSKPRVSQKHLQVMPENFYW